MKALILIFALFCCSHGFSIQLYTPQEAISDALSSDLKLIGTFVPSYSDSGLPTCLFRNEKVLLSMSYCLPSLIPAASLRIHSLDQKRGHISIYAEEITDRIDIANAVRSQYFDGTWSSGAKPNLASYDPNGSAMAYKSYDDAEARIGNWSCTQGQTGGTLCSKEYQTELKTWGVAAKSFWVAPGQEWYQLLKMLKTKVPRP